MSTSFPLLNPSQQKLELCARSWSIEDFSKRLQIEALGYEKCGNGDAKFDGRWIVNGG